MRLFLNSLWSTNVYFKELIVDISKEEVNIVMNNSLHDYHCHDHVAYWEEKIADSTFCLCVHL